MWTSAGATPSRPEIPPTRRVRRVDSWTILAALLLASSPAAADTAEEFFASGRLAFEQNDYQRALSAFQAAANAGLSGPAVHYNMGVAAYRLGRYEVAEAAFRAVATTEEMAALAHYNLGLVALRRADQRAAARWFRLARKGADDERLRDLATRRLEAMAQAREPNWVAYASVGAGYDDNVALASDADVLGVSGLDDTFTEAQFAFGAPLASPWRVEGGAVLLEYHELSAFDQLNAYGGARYELNAGRWRHEAFLSVGYAALDDERFETSRTVGLQTTLPLESDWRMRLRYRFSDVDAATAFAGLSGDRGEARLEMHRRWSAWELTCDYTYDRRDLAEPTLAARSHEAGVELSRNVQNVWSIGAQLRGRASRYDSGDDEQALQLFMRAARRLTSRWRIAVVYAYTDNDADVAGLDYVRHRVSAAIEMQL